MAIKFNIENNDLDNKSFALLRTNPKLSSNLKLITDSQGDIFLGAFKANKALSKVEYQKHQISEDGIYSNDVARFFKGLPVNERFELFRKDSDFTPFSDYAFQYENQYNYGVSFNSTKLYDEQYKIFAPIWLDRNVPKKFVIYRISGVDYDKKYNEDTLGQNSRILELLSEATIIKTFDLSKSSKLGKYLNSHVFSKEVKTSSISFNYGEAGASMFHGIDTSKGGFTSKKEFLSADYIQKDMPEIYANQVITSGFERNGIISSNLFNLEFLFDDYTADNYDIYRYFGVYVNDYEEGTFDIDDISRNGLISIKPGSVDTVYDLEGTTLEQEHMLPSSVDLDFPVLSYVKTGDNNYLHIKNNKSFSYLKLPVSKYNDDLEVSGFKKAKNKVQMESIKVSDKGFVKIEITENPNLNDRFFVADKTEIEISEYSLYDFTCIADPALTPGTSFGNKFSAAGDLNQVALAIASLIRKITTYTVTVDGPNVIIADYASGYNRKRLIFGIYGANLNDFMSVSIGKESNVGLTNALVPPGISTDFTEWRLYTTMGGSKKNGAFLVKGTELGDIKVGQYVKNKNLEKYSQVVEIINEHSDNSVYRIILDKSTELSNDGIIQVYDKFRPSFGKFSAYELKDFDFDFHSTANSELLDLQYENSNGVTFDSLTPILQQEDIDTDNNADPIYSEYDRLSENKLKETAVKSRIVPYISKWNLKNGFNARGLKYVLNANEAFGIDNLSPNIELESGRNSDNLNMEHFHFNKINQDLYNTEMKGLASFLDFNNTGGISLEELKSTDVDYFSLYFKWNGAYNPVSGEWVDNKFRKLFTNFENGIGELDSSTVFRGLRYVYKKRKETNKVEPTEFVKTTEVNDYKFGVVLDYKTGSEYDSNSVEYQVIKNDIFKFICIVITIYVVENDIDSLSRSLVYSLQDIKLNNEIVDTLIPFDIDLTRSDWNVLDEPVSVYSSQFAEIDGTAQFVSNITTNDEGNYSWIYFSDGLDTYGMKVVSVVSDFEIKVAGLPVIFNTSTGPDFSQPPMSVGQISAIPINTQYSYWQTGSAGWENIFNEIVAYNFARRFNKFGEINYITVNSNGESDNDFVLEVEDGVSVVKPSILTTSPDGDRPKSYQLFSGEIGKVLSPRQDSGYFTILRRMNGDYNPTFKDCITFTNIYQHHSTHIPDVGETTINTGGNLVSDRQHLIFNKFRNLNIAFRSYKDVDESYGFIENMYYHKVNEENSRNILKLSETSDKLPLYPTIGEIAINKRDVNVFKSKYADDYFIKSLPGGAFDKVYGTLTPSELKSFMVSTVMKVKDNYDLTKFSSTQESSIDILDYIRFNKQNENSIHWIEDDSQIIADFYLPKSIYNELLEDGIASKFDKYVTAENSFGDKTTIADDLEQYVYRNIVTRFIIESTDVYGIASKNLDTDFISVESPSQLKDGGYELQTNYEIQGYQNDGLSFRLIYNKKADYKYNLKLHIKIQA